MEPTSFCLEYFHSVHLNMSDTAASMALYTLSDYLNRYYGKKVLTITSFLDKKQFLPYWSNSSSNTLINNLIRQGSAQTKMIMENLLSGGQLETEAEDEIVFHQLLKNQNALWSLLLACGYLKLDQKIFCGKTNRFSYQLSITNYEVLFMFEKMFKDWFSDEDVPYNNFLKAFLCGDLDFMNEYMNQIAMLTFSSFDTGTRPSEYADPERFYHGFVLRLIAQLAGRYKISSNRESGFGRYDVMLEPLEDADPAFVLEFKVENPRKEACLEETLEEALNQIKEKDYDRELAGRGIKKERIRHYGFVFEGKKVLIGEG